MECAICGERFKRRHSRQITCSTECSMENRRRASLQRYHRMKGSPLSQPRKCTVCGAGYTPRGQNQKNCGSEECRKKLSVQRQRKFFALNPDYQKKQKEARRKKYYENLDYYRALYRERARNRTPEQKEKARQRERERRIEARAIVKAFKELMGRGE